MRRDSPAAAMIELRQYQTAANRSPYAEWFNRLDAAAAAKISVALSRVELGNTSNVETVGEGVSELRVNFGPGYRIYFGWDGPMLVILLGGGTKKRQNRDIEKAHTHWSDYKLRKKEAQKRMARQCH
jgi:putative addiction module killer protein